MVLKFVPVGNRPYLGIAPLNKAYKPVTANQVSSTTSLYEAYDARYQVHASCMSYPVLCYLGATEEIRCPVLMQGMVLQLADYTIDVAPKDKMQLAKGKQKMYKAGKINPLS